jgi:hypothetical protein
LLILSAFYTFSQSLICPTSPVTIKLTTSNLNNIFSHILITCEINSKIDLDSVNAEIILPKDVELIEGSNNWNGKLTKNQYVTFNLTIKFNKSGNYSIVGNVFKDLGNGNTAGDKYTLYLYIDEKSGKIGHKKKKDFEKNTLKKTTSKPPIIVAPDPNQKKTKKETPFIKSNINYAYDSLLEVKSPFGTVIVTGYFYYYDRNDNLVPAKYTTVNLFDQDIWPNTDDLLWVGLTDANGFFQSSPIVNSDEYGTLDIYALLVTGTDRRVVVTYSLIEDVYYWDTPVTNNVPDGIFDIGSWEIPNGSDNEGAMWIFQTLRDGWTYPPNDPGLCTVEWEHDGTGGAYYSIGGRVHLEGQYKNYPDVILHEAGHNYMYNIYGNYFPTTYCPSPHYWGVASHVNCAWTEGWASFFPCAVYNDNIWTATYTVNVETPPSGWDEGDNVEGRVCAALWDIFDNQNDGYDYYSFGFDEIWDVVYNQNDDNFSQFWSAWKSRGHPKHYSVSSIFQNTIDYNNSPILSGLPDIILNINSSINNAIDLWTFSSDVESSDEELSFSIIGNTNPSCGVSIDADRYIDVYPLVNWYGTSDVTLKVFDLIDWDYDIFTITVICPLPSQPGNISGNTFPCQGSSQGYSISSVSGATSYTWTLPSGWSGFSTTTSISTTAGTTGGTISVNANNDCGPSSASTMAVTVLSIPSQPGTISGNTSPCQGSSQTYSISSVSGATSYTWTLPSGWTGSSTSTSITSTVGSIGGTISVVANNSCGPGLARTLSVSVSTAPGQPGIISGNTSPCQGTSQTYSISAVSGATSYTWTLPSGWTGSSTSTSITSTVGSIGGTISVVANNSCGPGLARTLSVSVSTVPGQPGIISGNTSPCQGTSQTYSISSVSGATSYTWTLPSGWTGSSTSTSITTTVGSISGTISVIANNSCGTSLVRNLSVTVSAAPGQPGVISGPSYPCQNSSGNSYSVTNVSGTTYTWNYSGTGFTINSGQGTNNISVTYTSGATSGSWTVTPSNTCGNGTPRILSVTLIPLQSTLTNITVSTGQNTCYNACQTVTLAGNGTTFIVQNGGNVTIIAGQNIIFLPGVKVYSGGYLHGYITPSGPWCYQTDNIILPQSPDEKIEISFYTINDSKEKISFKIYPNPNPGTFTLELSEEPKGSPVMVKIYNLMGAEILETMIAAGKIHEFSLINQQPGIYLVQVVSVGMMGISKIIIQ